MKIILLLTTLAIVCFSNVTMAAEDNSIKGNLLNQTGRPLTLKLYGSAPTTDTERKFGTSNTTYSITPTEFGEDKIIQWIEIRDDAMPEPNLCRVFFRETYRAKRNPQNIRWIEEIDNPSNSSIRCEPTCSMGEDCSNNIDITIKKLKDTN